MVENGLPRLFGRKWISAYYTPFPYYYCLIDEKHVKHNAAKGVPRNVVIDGKRMSVKNIDLYKRVVEAEKKEDAVMEGSFKRINNQGFDIITKEQTKTLMTCTDNKR